MMQSINSPEILHGHLWIGKEQLDQAKYFFIHKRDLSLRDAPSFMINLPTFMEIGY